MDIFGIEISGAILAGAGAVLAGVGSFLSGLMAWKVGRQKLDESKREASDSDRGGESASGRVGLLGIDSSVPGGTGTDEDSDG